MVHAFPPSSPPRQLFQNGRKPSLYLSRASSSSSSTSSSSAAQFPKRRLHNNPSHPAAFSALVVRTNRRDIEMNHISGASGPVATLSLAKAVGGPYRRKLRAGTPAGAGFQRIRANSPSLSGKREQNSWPYPVAGDNGKIHGVNGSEPVMMVGLPASSEAP